MKVIIIDDCESCLYILKNNNHYICAQTQEKLDDLEYGCFPQSCPLSDLREGEIKTK